MGILHLKMCTQWGSSAVFLFFVRFVFRFSFSHILHWARRPVCRSLVSAVSFIRHWLDLWHAWKQTSAPNASGNVVVLFRVMPPVTQHKRTLGYTVYIVAASLLLIQFLLPAIKWPYQQIYISTIFIGQIKTAEILTDFGFSSSLNSFKDYESPKDGIVSDSNGAVFLHTLLIDSREADKWNCPHFFI